MHSKKQNQRCVVGPSVSVNICIYKSSSVMLTHCVTIYIPDYLYLCMDDLIWRDVKFNSCLCEIWYKTRDFNVSTERRLSDDNEESISTPIFT